MTRLPTFPPADQSTEERYPPLCAGPTQHFSLGKPLKHPEMDGYYTVDWPGIVWRAQNPEQGVAKENGFWVLPSTYRERQARSKYAQGEYGLFWLIWADIDSGDKDLASVVGAVRQLLDPGTEFLVFATKNSGRVDPEKPKYDGGKRWRVMVPTAGGIPAFGYRHLAGVFNRALAGALGVEPDKVSERIHQLLFLANEGVHYEYHYEPGVRWAEAASTVLADAMAAEAYELVKADPDVGNLKVYVARKKEQGRYIRLFNENNPTSELLERGGFIPDSNGVNWHHPDQTSSIHSTTLEDDGKWVTASSTVADMLGRQNGDAFDLYVAFEGGGNWDACFKAWCDLVNAEIERELKKYPMMAGFTVNGEIVFPGISL